MFLVVDFHAESRYLLSRTLRRKFPGAVIHECDEAAPALVVLRKESVSAVISHRTFEHSGGELVKMFRALKPAVPIVMVSGTDRAQAAREAGASLFLHYDEWLRLGTVVQGLIAAPSRDRRTVA